MKNVLKALSIPFFVFILSSVSPPTTLVLAQSDKKDTAAEEQKRRQEIERKTLLLVDEIVAASSSLKLPENRIFVLTTSANLVWPRDEKRARTLFWEAVNTLNVLPSTRASATNARSDNTAYFKTYGWRREILNIAARRDAQLALELLHASRQAPPESVDPNWIATERDLEQQIASASAENDPKRALQLARESMAKGLSLEILNLLFHLNQKDAELATKLAGEVADKIRTVEVNSDLNAYIAHWLLTSSRIPTENSSRLVDLVASGPNETHYRHLELPKEQRRALTEIMASTALSVSASPTLLSLVQNVMPEIEEFVPERVLLLKRKLSEIERRLPQKAKDQRRYNSVVRTGPPEEILRASLKGNDEERFWLEREAILIAVFSKKADALREFITKEIGDEGRRKTMLDTLDTQEMDLAAQRNDGEALRNLLPKIRLKEQRARAMAELAMMLETKGKHDEALTLLDEAQGLIKTDLQSETKSNALLSLMLAYALVEPSRAFAIVERTIDRANDDVSKLLLLDKFIKSGLIKKGELLMNNSVTIPMDFALLKYGKGVIALARADFGRTRAAADRFERQELRIFARLMIAQALLNGDQYINSKVAPINTSGSQ
jgi:hypothetical protein